MSRIWEACGRRIVTGDGLPRIMGVVNVTPDSFSDGGRHATPSLAAELASRLVNQGADLLDIGGESSRPGAEVVSLDEELRRVVPAIEAIGAAVAVPLSVDTVKPEVARRAIEAGAVVINDIEGLARDPKMLEVAAETGAGVVIMHMAGNPRTMQVAPRYADVVGEIFEFLARRVEAAQAAGIPRVRLAVDPGIGFGKTFEHNLQLLRGLRRFGDLGCAVLVGTSRKGFLGTITGRPVDDRVTASVVSSLAAAVHGADVLRVHDVGPMADAIKVWGATQGWDRTPDRA